MPVSHAILRTQTVSNQNWGLDFPPQAVSGSNWLRDYTTGVNNMLFANSSSYDTMLFWRYNNNRRTSLVLLKGW